MTSLILIAQEYRAAAQTLSDLDLDVQTIADTLEGIGGDLETKAQNVALMARSLDADAAAIKQWSKDASERAKATEARAERLREYLAACMTLAGAERIEAPGVVLSWRKSSAVVIDTPDLIPAEFWRQKPAPEAEPDKLKIAEAIKFGADVPGAHVEQRRSLQIK